LTSDLPGIWHDSATPARERKRIARLLLNDVTITRTRDTITAHVRLSGGQNHTLSVPAPKTAWELRQTPADIVTQIDQLLEHHTHTEIAAILNSQGHTSGETAPSTP
jgi:predicted RNase H-like HicB family nuclease